MHPDEFLDGRVGPDAALEVDVVALLYLLGAEGAAQPEGDGGRV